MKVFIGCSSSMNIDSEYLDLAYEVADTLAKKGYDLVFGAASTSMMGKLYEAFLKNGRHIIAATTPKYESDLEKLNGSENYICDTTFERMQKMYVEADALLMLPGGIGSLSEICNIIEENRTNNYKKFIIYNYKGFYDFLIKWLKDNIETGFTSKDIIDKIIIVNNMNDLLEQIERND